jgi:hypothetical protein
MGLSEERVEERMGVLTLCQLSKFDSCATDVFADRAGYASELAFTVAARLFIQEVFARMFCGQGRTSADGLYARKEFVCTIL